MSFQKINSTKIEVESTQIKTVFSSEFHPACPQVRSILHNCLCLDLLESICKTMHLFKNSTEYNAYIQYVISEKT